MIITFTSIKGGTGKTTSSVYLAAALMEHGSVQLIDTDPQKSLFMWSEQAGEPFPPTRAILSRAVRRDDTEGADFTIIDTPPGHPDSINAALAISDLIFLTTRPSHLDAQHAMMLAESLSAAGVQSNMLIVGAEARRRAMREVREYFANLPAGCDLQEHTVPYRAHAIGAAGLLPPARNLYPYDRIAEQLDQLRKGR